MKRAALCAACVLVAVQAIALSDEPSPGALLRRISTFRLEVANGRITSPTLGRAPNRTFSEDHGESKETLSINPSGDEPSLSYRYTSADREWTFDLQGNGSVRLQDTTAAESLVFEQKAEQPLKLTIQQGNLPKREMTARSLWHWLVFSQEACGLLLPRLEALRPDWDLAGQSREIRELLAKSDHRRWIQRRATWQRCVAQLADADYQVRQTADRTLCAGGAAAAAYLESLDSDEFGPEQSRRVARIIAAAAQDIDQPGAIAGGWCFDADVWCRLLQDEDAAARSLAADHLAQLLGRPLVFDPSAEVPIRSAQALVIEQTLIRR